MVDVKYLVEKVVEKVPVESGKLAEVEKKLRILTEEFAVPPDEAVRCLVNQLRREMGITATPRTTKIADLRNGETVNISFKVLRVSKGKGEKAECILLIGDETGITRAAVLKGATSVTFTVGKCYTVKNALSRDAVLITKASSVFEIEEDIRVKPKLFTGAIVSVGKNSGFVPRCPNCGAIIVGTACKTHGKVKPVISYEARLIVDDGERAIAVTVKEKDLETISKLSKDSANEMRATYASNEPVYTELLNRLIGRYVNVEIGETVHVSPVEVV